MAARRNHKRRDWPRGLYETAPGYYVWRHPTTHKQFNLGRVHFEVARNEALAANAHVAEQRPSLVARLSGATHTMADLAARMPVSTKANTAKSQRSLDKQVLDALGPDTLASAVTTADCAKAIDAARAAGKDRTAQALRSRMMVLFRKGCALGWMQRNPAEVTEAQTVAVKRDRLTLEQYLAIRLMATEWLPTAMDLLLITGQDRDTVVGMRRSMVRPVRNAATGEVVDCLVVQRAKTADTNQPVAIPLALRLDAVGLSLADVLARPCPVVSDYLVCHHIEYGNAPAGSPIFRDRVSKAFTEARKRAGIPDTMPSGKLAPTFYEIKSLAKRLYKQQGGVDTMHLFSHSERTDALYADPRGVEPLLVVLSSAK